jgi:conjugal transfer mating pair stabilization protein TraN
MRRLVVLVCLASMVSSQYATALGPQEDLAAARAANTYSHSQINAPSAAAAVPGYTATPPQTAHYGQPDLNAAVEARRQQCALLPNDPVCQAQQAANAVASGPLEVIAPGDPLVAPASAIARNPFGVASNLAGYYSGCSATGVCNPALFCLGERCFDITHKSDPDFAQAMTYMEAAREAGVYLDTATMRIFSGEDNRCRNRLLTNCCAADSAGAGFTNQSLFGVGSRLVFDILMKSSNRRFITQGMNALMTGAGFSGSFTTYGITVAASGTAVPAGAVTLYSGQNVIVAVDPYTLVIAIVMYVVMSLMSCSQDEGKLAMKEGAKLCHSIGTWCSKCIRVLGACVTCIERTTSKCCFNSQLARLINEQGRAQLGIGWGKAQQPQCEGFTVGQLQALDFSRMDLTEFYASIVPTLPDIAAMRATNTTRAASCYFGGGKC